jgi:hypothetical protein
MRFRMFVAATAFAATLMGQQSSQGGGGWSIDASGQRVEGSVYTLVESPAGSQRIETLRSINGRMVPLQGAEDRVLRQDGQGKLVERTIRKYDANGTPGPPIRVRIEEKKNPDGSTTILSTAYESDINGNQQLFERSTTEIRKGATTETSTTVERATLNGPLSMVERTRSVERPTGSGSQVDSTTYRRDVSGNFTAFSQEVKQIAKSGNQETTDAAHYEIGPDGKLALTSRAIDRVSTNPDGSRVTDTDLYSKFSAGRTGDPDAAQPRLQEQIHRERTAGAGGVVVEVTTSRARLPNDPSRFGAYEKVSQTTYTSTDAAGREVKNTETTVGRRDPNGQIITQEGRAERSVTVKPPAPASPPAPATPPAETKK